MEMESDNFGAAEAIFGKSLMTVPNVSLWTAYLNYIRRMNDLRNDATGNNRTTVSQAYDFVLNNIGVDRDSGIIWQEYMEFLRGIPGVIGGTSWQDGQKLDIMRKAYQRAIGVPMSTVSTLWKEYDQFETGANKMTARKYTTEQSPKYMTARSANTALENVTRGLDRSTIPKLPPAAGYEGHQEYMNQVELWKKWIAWEQEDPLVLKSDEPDVYKKRVLYVYKQATMTLRFWPEIWVEAAEWSFTNKLDSDGLEFLTNGIAANPGSCLLTFKYAERLEKEVSVDQAKTPKERGEVVRAPFDQLLNYLYDLYKQVKAREAKELEKVEE
jgi:cleavage stimulation factor subunit 3